MIPPRSFLIVYNPVAGDGRAEHMAHRVHQLLEKRGCACAARATACRGEAERIAAETVNDHRGEGPLCVVACGGDGTVQEIANVVAPAGYERAVMGIAPAGRCNDFARAMGVGRSCVQVVDVLVGGVPTPVDLGRVGDRYFCTIAAIGFDAAVSRFVSEMRLPLRGPAAYVYGILRVLLRYRTPIMRLSGADVDYEGPVFMAACANTPWYGGAMMIAPEADPFDGKLDVCLVAKTSRRRVLGMLPRVTTGRHVGLPEVRMLRAPHLAVQPLDDRGAREIWADGEPVGHAPATVESVPGAMSVMLPRDRRSGDANGE